MATISLTAPHKHGYRPDLPLRSSDASVMAWARAVELAYVKRTNGASKPVVSKTAPHPDSYRPDLPLSGFTNAQLFRPTKEDKAAWAARPLVIVANVFVQCAKCFGADAACKPCHGRGTRRRSVVETVAVAA